MIDPTRQAPDQKHPFSEIPEGTCVKKDIFGEWNLRMGAQHVKVYRRAAPHRDWIAITTGLINLSATGDGPNKAWKSLRVRLLEVAVDFGLIKADQQEKQA